ncbi:ATP-dependent DNA helicase PIF1 [Linum perenne]
MDELAILIVDETGEDTYHPDIIVQHISNEMERVSFFHPSLLQYPILFPYGEDGWHSNIMLSNTNHPTKCVSQCDYYAYRIQPRLRESSNLLVAEKLFQQYVVNAYALVEAERLDWIKNNQRKLRRHYFTGLSGQRVILSSSLTGSPRYKYENFQDAVAICRTLGYPNLFITFTFQKRGLPHAHMLVFLSAEDKIHSPSQIDSIISAEIPDVTTDPQCYDVVSRMMFHGPCGHLFPKSPCMVQGKCNKHFPKKINPETTIDEDGFPSYRRREDGRIVDRNGVQLDNRYVVPYNRYLLLRFDAHINVEFCNKSRAIKYLFKYINKPPDRNSSIGELLESESALTSMFLGWMNKNMICPQARQYTYVEFPQHYTWISKEKVWRERKKKFVIGRLYYCHPSSGERFYLRMLLHTVRGCTSFEDIKTVDNITYESFKETCSAYGFLADDGEWNHCLQEVSLTASSNQMRILFVRMIMYCQVVDVSSLSGIAALLMTGGRTAHSRFHIPIDIHSTSTCHIEQDGDLAELIRNTSLIIWDEASMTHKHFMESLDRTLRDIMSMKEKGNENLQFGGITVVFEGDFRQTLPVIPKSTRTEIVNSSIKRSYLWDGIEVIKLCQNMRLHREGCTSYEDDEIQSFSKWIVDIGDYVSSTFYGDSEVLIPPDIMVEQNEDPIADIVKTIYSDVHENYADPTYFADHAILAPLHEIVSLINDHMLTEFPGEETCYYSSDTIQNDGGQLDMLEAEFPTEFLNSMKIRNFPAHELKLKVGAPVILLRNIDQSTGLCNGTRLIIKRLGTWSVEVLTRSHAGDRVYLRRIALSSNQKSLNFTLIRRQYPIALCFAMTINKSQGQTLHQVGICLKRQVFTHGQLYVAISRVTKKSGLKIISCDEGGHPTSVMKNIVYHEVLN